MLSIPGTAVPALPTRAKRQGTGAREGLASGLQRTGARMTLFRRILVPHDFSHHADRALAVAVELARRHGGRVLVLHAIMPFEPAQPIPGGGLPLMPEDLVAGALRHLQGLAARIARGPKAPRVTCKVVIGDPFLRIADAARGADSIVMSTAGRTGLSHLLIGSVAEKVVRHAKIPVLTLRAARARPKAGRRRGRGRK